MLCAKLLLQPRARYPISLPVGSPLPNAGRAGRASIFAAVFRGFPTTAEVCMQWLLSGHKQRTKLARHFFDARGNLPVKV